MALKEKDKNSAPEGGGQDGSGAKQGASTLSTILKRFTLFLIVTALMGTLCVAGWAALQFDGVSWSSSMTRDDGLARVIRGEPFVVNLADRRNKHYAQVDYALVLAPGVAPDRVRERIPFIQERVTPYFLGRTAAELATPEGFEQARRELSAAVELIYSKAEVERVVVSQLVVQ